MGIGSKAWQEWTVEETEGVEVLKAAWDRGEHCIHEMIIFQGASLKQGQAFQLGTPPMFIPAA